MKRKFEEYTLVSDMDGTLLNSEGKLSDENIKAIKYFVDNGGKFTVATGRMLPSAGRFLDKLYINLPIILYNGSKIYDYKNNRVITEFYLEEERKHIIKLIEKDYPNMGIEIYSQEKVYIYQECEYTKRLSGKGYDIVRNVDESHWNQKWIKVLFISNKDEIDHLEEVFNSKYDSGSIIRSGEKFLEITYNDTSKGKALETVVYNLNLNRDKIIAIGDNMNDLELLEYANVGFVVNNGNEKLLKRNLLIAPSNDNNVIDYVVKWIERHVENI